MVKRRGTTQVNAASPSTASNEPWNGEFYARFGHSPEGRPWEDAVKYGFISAGEVLDLTALALTNIKPTTLAGVIALLGSGTV